MNNALISSFWDSGWFGKSILIILFTLSIYAWAIIAMKWRTLKEITRSSDKFLSLFKSIRGDILLLNKKYKSKEYSPYQELYETVCDELLTYLKLNGSDRITPLQLNTLLDIADQSISRQLIALEKYLIVLATTASISPLLGLLGTVWGVLISFRGMSAFGNASLAVVAPGISEALVTTVAGLIVAIPALVGYNWITNRLNILNRELENFSSRLVSYIQVIYTQTQNNRQLNPINSINPSEYEEEPAL